MIPSWSSPMPDLVLGEDHPARLDPAQLGLAELGAVGHDRARAAPPPRSGPAATLGAPQTIVCGSPRPTSTMQTLSRSASGCCSASSTRPIDERRRGRPRPTRCRRSSLSPAIVSGVGDLLGAQAGVAVGAQPGERDPHAPARTAPAGAGRCRRACAGRAPRRPARDPLDAHAEREALHALVVVAVAGHVVEHVGVDHPRAEDLDPALALAGAAALGALEAGAAAAEAGHVDLDARLGEREVARPQAHLGRPRRTSGARTRAATPWRSASVMSSSIARPSSWWNIGTCVASAVSGR